MALPLHGSSAGPSSTCEGAHNHQLLEALFTQQHHQLQQLLCQHRAALTETLERRFSSLEVPSRWRSCITPTKIADIAAVAATLHGTTRDAEAACGNSPSTVASGGKDADAASAASATAAAAVGAAAGSADDETRPQTAATESTSSRRSLRTIITAKKRDSNDLTKSVHLRPIFDSNSHIELSSPHLTARVRLRLKGRFVRSFFGACIVANAVVMFVHLQWLGSIANESLGLETDVDGWGSPKIVFLALEYVFSVIFLLELVLNLYAFRWKYLEDLFNLADGLIVVVTTLETFVLQPLAANIQNISFLRLLRIAKMIRAMRVFRMLGLFDSIQILIATIIYSTWSLLGSLVIMFILMLMCSIFLCSALHEFVIDETSDLATRTWVNSLFGSGDKSLYTVFEMTFSGCWPNYASRVVKDVSPFYAGFFAIYVAFVIFGLVRIISALFLRETMQQASRDADIIVKERSKKSRRMKMELNELFGRADVSHDEKLSLEEMADLMQLPKVRLWLGELGIDASDPQVLFELIDHDGSGDVSRDEFVEGMTRLKGEARAQDLVPVVTMSKRILGHSREILQTCQHVAAALGVDPKLESAKTLNYPLRDQ